MRRGENRSTRRKTSWSKDENQKQTQPTYDAVSGDQKLGHIGERRVLSPLHHPCYLLNECETAEILDKIEFIFYDN